MCRHHYPGSNCRADVSPRIVLNSSATKMLAAFIRGERWLHCSIRKDSMHLSSVVVSAVVAGELVEVNPAGCKIRCHGVESRYESRQ